MTSIGTAITTINTRLTEVLTPLITDNKIRSIEHGTRFTKPPDPPYLQIVYGKLKIDNTTIGGMGNNEAWQVPIHIGSTVKELENPSNGYMNTLNIISEARDLILTNRQLGLPNIIRKIDSNEIDLVPYPFTLAKNGKRTLYGAGTILDLLIIINNK